MKNGNPTGVAMAVADVKGLPGLLVNGNHRLGFGSLPDSSRNYWTTECAHTKFPAPKLFRLHFNPV